MANEYSPDVEIDHTGKLVYARDIAEGEIVRVPFHMLGRAAAGGLKSHTLQYAVPEDVWLAIHTGRLPK